MPWLEALIALAALAVAVSLKPWRALPAGGPPWPWLACAAVMPVAWGADRYADIAVAQPLSLACLLMLLAGWPLAVLAMLPVAVLTALAGGMDFAAGVERLVWIGLMPATIAMLLGAGVRRWLPKHLFVYILGRGFIVTALAGALAGGLAALLHPNPGGLGGGDLALARWLAAWGDAWITGILVAIFVAFRPHWLATYTDRLYLPKT